LQNPLLLDDIDLLTFARHRVFGRDDHLSEPEQKVLAVLELEDQVCNGGFVQYFCNTGGESIFHAEACAREIGANDIADLIAKAAVLQSEQEPSVRASAQKLRSFADYESYRLANLSMEDLDGPFYDGMKDLNHRLANFVRANLIHFV